MIQKCIFRYVLPFSKTSWLIYFCFNVPSSFLSCPADCFYELCWLIDTASVPYFVPSKWIWTFIFSTLFVMDRTVTKLRQWNQCKPAQLPTWIVLQYAHKFDNTSIPLGTMCLSMLLFYSPQVPSIHKCDMMISIIYRSFIQFLQQCQLIERSISNYSTYSFYILFSGMRLKSC